MPTGPSGKQLINEENFFEYVSAGQTYNIKGGITSTAHLSGRESYAATTHSVSDILQGSFYEFNPQDQLLVINQALTNSLTNLYGSDGAIHGFSSFTSTIPSLNNAPSLSNDGLGNGPVNLPEEGAVTAAWAAMKAGFQGDDLLKAVMIAGRESSWRNVKAEGSNDWGMWQINGVNFDTYGVVSGEELLNPIRAAEVAYAIYQAQGNQFATAWSASGHSQYLIDRGMGPAGWDPDGDPMWNTSQHEETARAAIEQAMNLSTSSTFDGAVSSLGTEIVNTIEEFKFAGAQIANHPNMHAGMDTVLKEGFVSQTYEPTEYISAWFPSVNRGFLVPSLLNYLWYILEGGFILDNYVGSYFHRKKRGGDSLSNHAHGGAVDFGKLGVPGSTAIGYRDPKWRSYNDQLFQYLSTLSRDTKPEEVGSTFSYTYSGWYNVFEDPVPTHIHLGFGQDQVGQLISALKPSGNSKVQYLNNRLKSLPRF